MRLTTRTNLAMRSLMYCAAHAPRNVRKHEIAQACNASENHLAQVINTLAQQGFVATQRGRAGGLRLARPAQAISVGAVFRGFEQALPFAECFDPGTNTCPLTECCLLRPALKAALDAFYTSLDALSLADLVDGNQALYQMLTGTSLANPSPRCHNRVGQRAAR